MNKVFAVIDTETTLNNNVMSIGIVISNFDTFEIIEKLYYIITPFCDEYAIYSEQLYKTRGFTGKKLNRQEAITEIKNIFSDYGVESLFAYNASFDYNHIPEFNCYEWFDIMRIAAYKQHNFALPADEEYCTTGRLKVNYGVEHIYRLLSGKRYHEIHNALCDAIDELAIMKMLNKDYPNYICARIVK